MKINSHSGHNRHTPGANKYLDEVTENRKVNSEFIKLLENEGHTVYDCTDDNGKTANDNLYNIVKECNAHDVDLDVSHHLNAGGGTGVEVWLYDNSKNSPVEEAKRVAEKVSKALGIPNRGVKYSKDLYVLRETKAPAMLVECCFVDNKTDKAKWNANKCAKAIVEGILNKNIDDSKPAQKPDNKPSGSTKYKVGDTVNINGVYTSSTSSSKLKPAKTSGEITKILAGAKNPYLLDNGNLGWVNDGCITGKKGSSSANTSKPKTLKVGMKAKPKKAVSYEGVSLASFVTKKYYTVIEIKGKRVVLGDGLNTAFNIDNLTY